jgi:glycosyltransferase-like protein LARGE
MYKSGLARPHSRSKVAPSAPSLLGRLARLAFTLYLLTAISYTSWHFLLQPVTSIILYGSAAGHPVLPTAEDLTYIASPADTKADLDAKIERALQISEDKGDRLWGKPTKKKGQGHREQAARLAAGAGAGAEGTSEGAMGVDPRSPVVSHYSVTGDDWSTDLMLWYPPSDSRSHPHGRHATSALRSAPDVHRKATPMVEDFFLSKAFGEALQPSKVVPYYYKASADFAQEDITITTLVTSNRLKVLANLVEHYQGASAPLMHARRAYVRTGPVSVTLHVTNNPETKTELLESLHALYTSVPAMSTWVDVHLVIDNFDRQFNMWRNIAKFFARTDYVMMLDVDFWICTDFRTRILSSPVILSKLREGTAAFVVPAFEYNKQEDGVDVETFPKDKEVRGTERLVLKARQLLSAQGLLDLVTAKKIDMFHKSWQPGHGATNYTRYYQSKPGEVYRVHSYTHSYEVRGPPAACVSDAEPAHSRMSSTGKKGRLCECARAV